MLYSRAASGMRNSSASKHPAIELTELKCKWNYGCCNYLTLSTYAQDILF